ncbi:MAG: Maf family protein [Clostridia bacterium]|nr:Maf family protein [Clostridia bacterium]
MLMRVILASQSPRRREILTTLGVDFEVLVSEADECCTLTDPADFVQELSRRKAQAVADSNDFSADTLIIGCDTVVVSDGKILGKPKDREDAKAMLRNLSGKAHYVYSGLTLIYDGKVYTSFDRTAVHFSQMSDMEIERYVATGEPDDKAGAYAIQGKAARFIAGIEGCYYNVVGLPVALLSKLVHEHGIPLFEDNNG